MTKAESLAATMLVIRKVVSTEYLILRKRFSPDNERECWSIKNPQSEEFLLARKATDYDDGGSINIALFEGLEKCNNLQDLVSGPLTGFYLEKSSREIATMADIVNKTYDLLNIRRN